MPETNDVETKDAFAPGSQKRSREENDEEQEKEGNDEVQPPPNKKVKAE